jgi:phage recombination protein Bet
MEVISMSNQQQDAKDAMKAELTVKYDVNGSQVILTPSIVQQYIVSGSGTITMPEFKLFTELCKVRKLNPFLKEAYLIKFGSSPAQIVVGKDAVLKRAVLNPKYDGMESGVIVVEPDGNIEERKGLFYLKPNETLVGGWAKVYRKDWTHPIYCSIAFDEAAQRKNGGELNSNWAQKPATMIEKVAKVRALREAFVEELSGMYDEDEMPLPVNNEQAYTEPEIIPQEEPEIVSQPEPADEPIDVTFDEL